MTNCAFCKKETLLKFIMSFYKLRATEIAKELNVSDTLVRKHLDGDRNCEMVDLYLIKHCFGITVERYVCAES